MKTYIKYIAIIAVAFGMNSCSKKNIRFKPIDRISIDAAFSSPSLIALSMNGMYNAAQIGQYNSTNKTEEEDMCGCSVRTTGR
jgi:hypothetical protein